MNEREILKKDVEILKHSVKCITELVNHNFELIKLYSSVPGSFIELPKLMDKIK